MVQVYNKLVRDKIPEIIKNRGGKPNCRILNDAEYKKSLLDKLYEEYQEVIKSEKSEELIEECADVLEVIFAIAKNEKISQDKLLKIMMEKRKKRGGFENKIFLESVEEE